MPDDVIREASRLLREASEVAPATKKLYHLTDKANFKLKPRFHPQNNTTLGGQWPEAGIFLGHSPEAWVHGYGYWRPYVAEFEVPEDIASHSGLGSTGYGGEVFVPSSRFKDVKLNRVIPLDAYAREEYGGLGWTEDPQDYGGEHTDFETGQPLPADYGTWENMYPFKGYRFQGDVRDRPEEWRKAYEQRFRKFRREQLRQRKLLEDAGI